jgi:hypothetical protein
MDNQPMSRKAPPASQVPPSVNTPVLPLRGDPGAAAPSSAGQPPVARRAGRKAEDPVSLGLRKLWEHVEKEPVPDSMLSLLDAIDAARNSSAAKDGDANAPPAATGDGA